MGATKAVVGMFAAADVPKQYQWATKCDYDGNDWDKYHRFGYMVSKIKSRDACMVLGTHMFTVADLNDDLALSKCEHQFACVAALYKKGQSKKTDLENAKKCAIGITKVHKADPGKFTLKDMAQGCADH